jgi:Uma2 family endonuclease
MISKATTYTVAKPKHKSVNKLDRFELNYIKERNKPLPGKFHSLVQSNLIFDLYTHCGKKYDILSELSLELASGNTTPDICLYKIDILDFTHDEVRVTIPPLLAIEILSPKQNIDEIKTKYRNIYLPADIKSVWLIIPELKIVALGLPDGQFEVVKTDVVKDMYLDIELPVLYIFK